MIDEEDLQEKVNLLSIVLASNFGEHYKNYVNYNSVWRRDNPENIVFFLAFINSKEDDRHIFCNAHAEFSKILRVIFLESGLSPKATFDFLNVFLTKDTDFVLNSIVLSLREKDKKACLKPEINQKKSELTEIRQKMSEAKNGKYKEEHDRANSELYALLLKFDIKSSSVDSAKECARAVKNICAPAFKCFVALQGLEETVKNIDENIVVFDGSLDEEVKRPNDILPIHVNVRVKN